MKQKGQKESGWKSVAENTHNDEHWHYGKEGGEDWSSITANEQGPIDLAPVGTWLVEFYDGESGIQRQIVSDRESMLIEVGRFMQAHESNIQTDSE